MSFYRPNYRDHPRSYHDPLPPPPPSNFMPLLPHGPSPPYDSNQPGDPPDRQPGHYDSWRPVNWSDRHSEFTFRNGAHAPQYPPEQDHLRPTRSTEYARQENNRPKQRKNRRDDMKLNPARRGQYHQYGKYNRPAPSDRPLLRHHDDEGNSSEQMLGMINGQASVSKFMAAEDLSDSEEEQMDESHSSDSEEEQMDESHSEGAQLNSGDANQGETIEGTLEPPAKRRALATSSRNAKDGSSEPKWSNPDPYTVLPPVDESQRKKKDVVKLIRKARKEAETAGGERNQVAANDDFISFAIDENTPGTAEEVHSSPTADWRKEYGAGVPGAPTGPRQFSRLENLHSGDAPGASGNTISADKLGPPPGLPSSLSPSLPPPPSVLPEKVVLDTVLSTAGISARADRAAFDGDEDEALGSRKRTHNDRIRYNGRDSSGRSERKGKREKASGSIVEDWVPGHGIDPIPWVRRSDKITANAGFRLHKEICDFYEFVRPQDFEQTIREELVSRLQSVVSREIPHCEVHCFGSFAAGLYLPTADMDVVIISDSFRSSGLKVVCQIKNQMYKLGRFLEYSKLARAGSVEVVPSAKVPIIKFVDRVTGIKIDVSFENDTGIIANDTFAAWKRQFPAMPVLVTIVKQFLMMRGLNEVQFGGLGGFSVTCLVTSLLQNMPRVQTGELIPEEHLGEMLIEFLDFYGNRLDTTRSGLMMNPPGYFDKQAYDRPSLRGPVYKANKADRLAIVDPNNPANDISGGSSEVMRIFDRFSKAHAEILAAMKAPDRPSLLDWSLGGNYESFVRQRNHLLGLYKEKWETPAGISDQYQLPERTLPPANEPLAEIRGPAPANRHNLQVPKQTIQPAQPPPKAIVDMQRKELQARTARAEDLRKRYPDMSNLPQDISREQMRKLIDQYNQQRGNLNKNSAMPSVKAQNSRKGSSAKASVRTAKQDDTSRKNSERATRLKQDYPEIAGLIPDKVGRKASKGIIGHPASRASMTVRAQLPTSPAPPAHTQGTYPTRQHATLHGIPSGRLVNTSAIQNISNGSLRNASARIPRISNKMAPLTDERRVEVIRNLSGLSHVDPINID